MELYLMHSTLHGVATVGKRAFEISIVAVFSLQSTTPPYTPGTVETARLDRSLANHVPLGGLGQRTPHSLIFFALLERIFSRIISTPE